MDTLQNPLLRERLKLGRTQHEVAEDLGVTRNFIVRAESAEYPEPPRNVVEYYAGGDNSGVGNRADLLASQYKAYQITQREEHYGMLYPYFEAPEEFLSPVGPAAEHPLTMWLLRSTQIDPEAPGISVDKGGSYPYPPTLYALCRAFCVHHAVMYRWLKDAKTVKKVPKVFLAALFESGYSEQCLIALEGAYEIHRSALLEL